MNDFRIAVKAFIVDENKNVLLLRRKLDNPHKPGVWDIPGGRLDHGENPFDGLKREVKEETNLEVNIQSPIDVHHFTRDDGQNITMLIFSCQPLDNNIILSEHDMYDWVPVSRIKDKICPTFYPLVDRYIQDYGN